jgi:hypothetical protein
LVHPVPTVVNEDGEVRIAIGERTQKRAVPLITDNNVDSLLRELFAFWINVYADDSYSRPEIVSPHPQRASVENADLDHSQRLTAKAGEVTVVDLEVVEQLVDQPAVRLVFEVFDERVAALIVLLFARD